ncbi:MAG: HEPN domain-containing protein [Candidatus Wallbacteria bacterium]|nr:HEPN domain-containing protein [Candidatus Wallbacteria bacterium]
MNITEHVEFWKNCADHDLETAEMLFSSGRFDWCLFVAHLVVEKLLKACYVRDNGNRVPPKTHNLLKLAECTALQLSESQKLLLSEVSDFNIETRYPEYKNEFYKQCTREFTLDYFSRMKELTVWLKSRLK